MGDQHNAFSNDATPRKNRPTIGFFNINISDDWALLAWQGVVDASCKHDVNLVSFVGGIVSHDQSNDNIVYDLARGERLDGLIIWKAGLVMALSETEIEAFCKRYGIPVVTLEGSLNGCPCVSYENYLGLRNLTEHLIEVHGCEKIGFLGMYEHHKGFQERYRGYEDAMTAHGLSIEPVLARPGFPAEKIAGGRIEEQTLDDYLDKALALGMEAVIGIADGIALQAHGKLQGRGVRVPEEVAVVGFDDAYEGRVVAPPLTTVKAPFYELGFAAVDTLVDLLAGRPVPELVTVPAILVVRQSCGCQDPYVAAVTANSVQAPLPPPEIASAMVQAAKVNGIEVAQHEIDLLLEAFTAELSGGESGAFLDVLDHTLQRSSATIDELSRWHAVTLALQQHMNYEDGKRRQAEGLLQQAQVLISRVAERTQMLRGSRAEQEENRFREVGLSLITTLDVNALMDAVVDRLPGRGIPSCYLSLFEDPRPYQYPDPSPEWARLVVAYDPRGRAQLAQGGLRFPARKLIPDELWPQDRACSFVLLSLYFQEEQMGFVLFESGSRDGKIYETLQTQISSALHGAQLVWQVERRALQLQTAAEVARAAIGVLDLGALLQQVVALVQRRFDLYYVGLFLIQGVDSPEGESAPDGSSGPSAWAVLRAASGEAGRQMLERGHRLAVGGESMIGQCIADHHPRIALDVGEEAVRFDNPLLPETHSEMALPLVGREGAIGALSVQSRERGAFGEAEVAVFETLAGQLANAIANVRAYEQVAHAYDEIQRLNERLKDENLRMAAELEVTRRLQQMLLPTAEELMRIEGLDIAGYMEPAEEVGGDYYDVLQHNGSVKIGIGDVTGHGLESGVVMLMLQTAVRTLLTEGEEDPVRFLEVLNQLLRDNTQRMQVSKSMTLSLLDYELGRMRLSGQHEYVIVVRAGGRIELMDTADLGFPLGIEHGIAQWVDEMDVALAPGDGVVLYSDGITEAEDEGGEFYGLERLCEVVSANWGGSAEAIKSAVVADVKAFIGTQTVYDDLTLVVVKQQ